MLTLSEEQVARFHADGFLILDRIVEPNSARQLAARFEPLFAGEFETGLQPDEWNWRTGRDAPDLTRQICNGWKADRAVAATVLREDIGRASAQLMNWPGARLYQDNVLWKPPGAKALGFHQDDSYVQWVAPPGMVTCWIALDDTTAAGGTIEYVRGAHRWPVSPPIEQFHAPDDPLQDLRPAAALAGVAELEIVKVEVPAGGGTFHHGHTWHGSGVNRGDRPRRSVVAHCLSSEARFGPGQPGPIYGRYKRFGDDTMEESFFPILWTEDGRRSPFIETYSAARTLGSDGGS